MLEWTLFSARMEENSYCMRQWLGHGEVFFLQGAGVKSCEMNALHLDALMACLLESSIHKASGVLMVASFRKSAH